MAAEPTPQQSVEVNATPAVLRTEDGSLDAPENPPTDAPGGPDVNGESSAAIVDKLVNDIVDEVVNSTEVSISGGSDTEASRPDLAKKDDKGHSRTSSVKRPATFKSVSVNKTFLASKTTSSTSAPKVGEKSTTPVSAAAVPTSTSAAPKPRLVAKSAGGLRDASKSSLSQNGRSAPDGNAVWNKNRPVPQPDPKKLTDEELAKIGIHMANRLQPDDAKGQSTWADIDDEDEDWEAPEAITWTDGTKTTIPHVDEIENTPEQPVIKENKLVDKPRSPAPSSGSPSVKPGFLASGKGLVLKSASSEKPTLVAKPPAPPTPVKSPWAALPPVSRVSPMDAPNEPPHGRFQPPSQAYGLRGGPPPAAREIAADDFSRSPRRDNQQLFNSQSGRYEPVSDRRGMPRSDFHQRQPAVLQRPIHSETQGPAEPSPAFQTTHTSGGYGRRRGSSNVSGGSGSFQRMGRPFDQSMPPPELLNARRSSLASAGDHPISPHNFSPSGPQGGPRQPSAPPHEHLASPAMSSATAHVPDGGFDTAARGFDTSAPQGAVENTVEFQKRLMQERRAEAIKRRQEEEAKEEAARKERLAKKLAALGPAPERKSAKKDDAQEAQKVTADKSADKSTETSETPQAQALKDSQLPKAAVDNTTGLLPNGVQLDTQSQLKPPTAPAQPPVAENKHGHPWQSRLPNQPERIWGQGSQAFRNVWGSPNNDRTLGNGTFSNAGFDSQPSQTATMQSSRPAPGPIAPPPRTTAPAGPSSRLGPIGPPQRNGSHEDEKVQNRNRWAQAVVVGDAELRTKQREQRAEMERDMKARGLSYSDLDRQYKPIKDQWTETSEDGQTVKRVEEMTHGNDAPWTAATGDRPDDRHRPATANSVGPNGTTAATQQSRFFPSGRDVQPEPLAPDIGRPPEEGSSHPAFDGDALHPHVSLPRTKPIVKLPPTSASAPTTSQRPSQSASTWGQGPSFRDDGMGRSQPLRSTFGASNSGFSQGANSQIVDRIKNLFADKPSSVNSSSRTALAQAAPATPATVSLPGIYAPSTVVDDRSFVTKTMDEDCFEEQEMGSLPPVHLPADTPEAAYSPARPPPRQDRRLLPVVPATADALTFFPDGRSIFIQLPNIPGRKSVPMAALRSPNPRRGPRSGSRFGSSHRGGNRSRDSATPYSSPEQASSSGTAPGRGGRGYRGRSENWGRAAAAPAIQTQ